MTSATPSPAEPDGPDQRRRRRRRVAARAGAGLLAALAAMLLLGVLLTEAPPPLGRDLPDGPAAASAAFAERIRERFPAGTGHAAIAGALAGQGFAVVELEPGTAASAALVEGLRALPGERRWYAARAEAFDILCKRLYQVSWSRSAGGEAIDRPHGEVVAYCL